MKTSSFTRLAVASALLVSVAGMASAAPTDGPFFRAVLTHGTAPVTIISNEMVWHGSGSTLSAGQSEDRPLFVCQTLARDVGALDTFEVQGAAVAKDMLEKCNVKAHK